MELANIACGGDSNGSSNSVTSIDIFSPVNYDTGMTPVVAGVQNANIIIEMHASSGGALYYHVATADLDNNRVDWGGTYSFNAGEAGASISIADDPGNGTGSSLMLVYSGRLNDGALWVSLGNLSAGSTTAEWVISSYYRRSSQDVKPACTYACNKTMVEVLDGSTLDWKLWYSLVQ